MHLSERRALKRSRRQVQSSLAKRGRRIGSRRLQPAESGYQLDFGKIASSAILRLGRTGNAHESSLLTKADLHVQVHSQKPQRLIVFAVDISDSMGDGPSGRISAAFGAIVSLASTAYLNRDRVSLIAFRDREARVVVPPTDSVTLIREQINRLPIGGATPLATALDKVQRVIHQERIKNPHVQPLLILISDGEATVSMTNGADPHQEALALARQLRKSGVQAVVIDTLPAHLRTGHMPRLAESMGTTCRHIHNLQASQILALIDNNETFSSSKTT